MAATRRPINLGRVAIGRGRSMAMKNDQDVLRVARHLIETRGGNAARRAAQRAAELESQGEDTAARLWRSIEHAIDCIESGRCGRPS